MQTKNVLFAITIVLILAMPLSGYAQSQISPAVSVAQKMIQTYGEAELTSQPDLAQISLSIETHSKLADDAVEENARIANAVRQALLDFGLSKDNLKTGSYRLRSYRELSRENPDIEKELLYYQATNEIIVSTAQLDKVGEIIDLMVISGANNINYISFELRDPQDLMIHALEMATQQAYRKAKAIAESIGEAIETVHSIREEKTDYTPYRFQSNMLQREMTVSALPTPISPDEVTVRATVITEFSLKIK